MVLRRNFLVYLLEAVHAKGNNLSSICRLRAIKGQLSTQCYVSPTINTIIIRKLRAWRPICRKSESEGHKQLLGGAQYSFPVTSESLLYT